MGKRKKKLKLTQHACDRAKERLKWRPKVLEKMMKRAYTEGITGEHTKGRIKKFIENINTKYSTTAHDSRIYGEVVYVFSHDGVLITVYIIPRELRRYLNEFRK